MLKHQNDIAQPALKSDLKGMTFEPNEIQESPSSFILLKD